MRSASLRPSVALAVALAACGDARPSGPVDLTRGDTTLRTLADGSFALEVGGRVLVQSRAAPVELRTMNLLVQSLWGQHEFDEGETTSTRPARRKDARVDGEDLLLALDGADGDGATATLRFRRLADEVSITVEGALPATNAAGPASAIALHLACRDRDRFLGFGEQYQRIDHRGEAFPLVVSEQGIGRDPARRNPLSGDPWTTYYPVPFFLDPGQGFGLAVDTDARVKVDLCKADPAEYTLAADEPERVLIHVYTGPTPAAVLAAFTVRQGRSLPVPRWAIEGTWLGLQGGPGKVRDAVKTARDAGAVISTVWAQDWLGATDLGGGLTDIKYHWTGDAAQYPDLPGFIKALHDDKVRFLGYFNPFVLPKFDQWADAVKLGYLPTNADGTPWKQLLTIDEGSMVDLTNPAAVAWFQTFARAALAQGQDGWMGDFGEWLPYGARLHAGTPRTEHNRYPLRWHETWKDLVDADKVVFTRSGWLGDAHVAQVVWTGDPTTDWSPWDGLPTMGPALISLGLVGIGHVTHDVAGYYSAGAIPPSTKELYLRWMELGAFTPIFRTHEGLASKTNWTWFADAETLTAFSRWTRVHAALADTFTKLGEEHRATGMPIVRALALHYADDDAAVTTSDEFLIGDDLLVAPVTTAGATTRSVYFPKGRFTSVWDPKVVYDGPARVTVDAPIGRPPVFSRSGRVDLAGIR